MNKKLIRCPVCLGKNNQCVACNGEGKLQPPRERNRIEDPEGERKAAAEMLRNYGYTFREIANILGYKHPGSVSSLLHKKSKQ